MRVFLTGATGLLGNNIMRSLIDAGHTVQATVRPGTSQLALAGLKFEPIAGDLAQVAQMLRDVSDFDVLIHSAAMIQIGWSKLAESRAINVLATERLAEFCRLRKKRMIHISTVDTLGHSPDRTPRAENQREPTKPLCTYVVSKREGEQRVLDQINLGLDAIILHPGFMLGPWDWKPSSGAMLQAVGMGWTPFAPLGGCSVVDVRDVADGVLRAIYHGKTGHSYILAGENISYLDLWQRIASVAGRKGPKRTLSNWLAAGAGRAGDILAAIRRREPLVNSAATSMGQLHHYYSSELAKRELGFKIGSIDDALHDAWNWLAANGYLGRKR